MKDDSFDCTLIAHLRIFLLFYRLLYCLILPENRLFFGIWKVVEIEVKDANHITVKFKDGTIVKDRKYEDFIHGAIGKPGIPQLRRTLKNERLWTEKIMRNGMKAKIVRYGSANDIDIKFSNGTIVMHKTYANFCSGSVACK